MEISPRPAVLRALSLLCLTIATLSLATAANADVFLEGRNAAFLTWAPAAGPVAGYYVYEARNGAPFRSQPIATRPPEVRSVRIIGNYGDSVRVRVVAFGADGTRGGHSGPSQTIRFVDPSQAPAANLDADAATVFVPSLVGAGSFAIVRASRLDGSLVGLFTYSAQTLPRDVTMSAVADLRAAMCDFEGDGDPEYVLGFGSGSGAWLEIRNSKSEGFSPRRWIQVLEAGYAEANGETRPACGDVDGDGRDELIVGLGRGSNSTIHVFDDATTGFGPLARLTSSNLFYNHLNGETFPALGDFDHDGRDEIVLGLGEWGSGKLVLYDDAFAGFAHFAYAGGSLSVPWNATGFTSQETHPVVADIDDDGWDEIVVGTGVGGSGGVHLLDDYRSGFRPLATAYGNGWIPVGWGQQSGYDGASWPSAVDLDGDGSLELLVGFSAGEGGRLRVLEGALDDYQPVDAAGPTGWLNQDLWGATNGRSAVATP